MADPINYSPADFNSLRWSQADVTPNDDTDLPRTFAAITCASSGTIRVTASGGGTATHYCNAGQPLLVMVDRVFATDTTATGIVALYQS